MKINSTNQLRDYLFDELRLFRANKISAKRAQVTANLSRSIIDTMKIDIIARGLFLTDAGKNTLRNLPKTQVG